MASLGIDIGATKTHAVALDDDNQVVAEAGRFTILGQPGVAAGCLEMATAVAEQAGLGLRDFDGVGIGIAGVINRETGEITNAVNLKISHMPLKTLIAQHFSCPIRIDNDVKATAVAAGMLLDSLSVTYLNFGTGVASATLAGRLIRGHDNAAGEIGHLVFDPAGSLCRCGQHGCLETVVGGSYLAPRLDQLGLEWATLDQDTSAVGQATRRQAVQVIAHLVTMMSLVYASDHIVLGGGVIQAAPWVLAAVRQELRTWGHTAKFPHYDRIADLTIVLEQDLRLPAIGAALIGQGWTEGYTL